MRSALQSFLSALGVGSACYVLAMASWQQVLFLFLAASLGWSFFVWQQERRKELYGPKSVIKRVPEMVSTYTAPKQPLEPVQPVVYDQRRAIYRFPIHELTRSAQKNG